MEIEVQGRRMLVDADDFQFVSSSRWNLHRSKCGRLYAQNGRGLLARLLLDAPEGMHVDHKNGNTLDNRRCNLRVCTHSENQWNRKRSHGATKLKGVTRISDPRAVRKWRATIQKHGRRTTLGMFYTALEAAFAYDSAAVELFGEFASPNFPERFRN